MAFQFQETASLLCTINRIHEDKVAEAWRKDLLPLREIRRCSYRFCKGQQRKYPLFFQDRNYGYRLVDKFLRSEAVFCQHFFHFDQWNYGVGFKTINNVTYYFYSGSGAMATGWVENTDKGTKYYFDPTTGAMYTGTQTIDGVTYVFSDTGVCQGEKQNDPTPDGNTGSKTIKNYLAGALMPVGKALYVWGGGWNDSTRKGLSDTMTNWYNKWSANPSGYDYNNYRDLSTSNRAKGFD